MAEGKARQTRKRVAADVVFLDESGRLLLVDPDDKPYWDLPGGMAEVNEAPFEAARREVREELGIELSACVLLAVDWASPHGPWGDTQMFIFDGGVLTETEKCAIRIHDEELRSFQFCTEQESASMLYGLMSGNGSPCPFGGDRGPGALTPERKSGRGARWTDVTFRTG
jgi:8-oxo-dGTP diphosphatase